MVNFSSTWLLRFAFALRFCLVSVALTSDIVPGGARHVKGRSRFFRETQIRRVKSPWSFHRGVI